MNPDEMDAVFAALASEPRRRVLDVLKREPGCNVNRVCEFFDDMGRVAVMKHLDVLEGANLVLSEKHGRQRLLWFNPVPIDVISIVARRYTASPKKTKSESRPLDKR